MHNSPKEVSHGASALASILDQFRHIVEYDELALFRVADATLIVAAHSEAVSSGYALNQVVSLDECTEDDRSLFESEPLIVPDIRANTPVAAMFRLLAGAEADDDACPRAWLSVPLHVDERLVGILVFGHSEPRYYSPQLVEPICALAGDVGMSIENTLLYDRTALQAERLGTLLAVQRAITSRLELDDVLRMIADEARRLTGSHQGFVMLLEGDDLVLKVLAGDPTPRLHAGYRLPLNRSMAGLALRERRPQYSHDALHDARVNYDISVKGDTRSMLNVPLMSGDRPLGSIVVTNKIQGVYGPDDEWILGALAPAAVIGLENARLYAQAEGLARLQERQRIAQSLHDSLAQMLFGLGLQVREMLADPGLDGSVRRKLKVVGRLAGRSSYDLRNAIYALRSRQSPAGALEGLQEQIEAFQAASDISATLITPSDLPALPDSLSDVFCLVTREALSNVRKHAHASAVVVSLRCDGDTFVLTIQDNGIGLDAAKVGGDGEDELHFGIDSMRDIVNRAGGEFLLSSNDDAGTTVRVQMPVPEGHTT